MSKHDLLISAAADAPPARQAAALENVGRCVRLSRRTSFSSGHLYAQPRLSAEENRRVFGRCFSERGHGHTYRLEAFYVGRIQAETGIVANLIDVDRVLRECVDPLEHAHLNFDVPFFADRVPTTENVARYCFEALAARAFPEMLLESVRVHEDEDLWADWADMDLALARTPPGARRTLAEMASAVARAEGADGRADGRTNGRAECVRWTFEASAFAQHSLSHPALADEENERLYGACYRLHGHDYRVQASFLGEFDERSGLFADRERLARAVERAIIAPFRGRNLNSLFANTSCESMVCVWFELLENELARMRKAGELAGEASLDRLAVQETRKNWFARTRGSAAGDVHVRSGSETNSV